MSTLSKQYKIIEMAINGRNTKERLMLLVVVLALIFMAWQTLFYDTAAKDIKRLQKKEQTAKANIIDTKRQIKMLFEQLGDDPTKALQKQIEQLQRELVTVNTQLQELMGSLIAPSEMVKIFRQFVTEDKSINIRVVKNLAPQKLELTKTIDSKQQDKPQKTSVRLYKHGVDLELSGSFFDILSYLHDLESLDKKIIWESIDYEVTEYPIATIKLKVSTISNENNWIGV